MNPHHWNIKLVQLLPSVMFQSKNVDLLVLEVSSVPDFAHRGFDVHAQAAVLMCEQGQTQTMLQEASCCPHNSDADVRERV